MLKLLSFFMVTIGFQGFVFGGSCEFKMAIKKINYCHGKSKANIMICGYEVEFIEVCQKLAQVGNK